MNKNLKLIIPCALLIASCIGNHTFPTNTKELIQYYEREGEDIFDSPMSGAFLVAKNDSILFKGGVGYTDLKLKQNINADTRFYIGSLSKQFTAALILILAQDGKLDLNNPISTYLPDYPEEKGNTITIHHLLSNTSGLPHYPELFKFGYNARKFFSNPISRSEYVNLIAKMDLEFTPGSNYQYSSFGFILLGVIIENITGQDFQTVLHDRIVKPLKLSNTGYSDEMITDNIAEDKRYVSKLIGGHFKEIPPRELSTAFSAGGIYSSLNDLYAWSKGIKNNSLLNSHFQSLLFKPNIQGYCYGLFKNPEEFLRKNHNVQLYFHGGGIMGYRSAIAMYEDGTTIIALMNTLPLDNNVNFITQLHLSAFGKQKPVKHFIYPSLRNLPHFYEEGGLTGVNKYHDRLSKIAGYNIHPSSRAMKKIVLMHLEDKEYVSSIKEYTRKYLSSRPDLPEALINAIGYAYLEKKELEEACSVFIENISRFPNSPNVYDSYGEALEKMGKLEEARAEYAKAVALAKKRGNLNIELYQKNLDRLSQ